ncbi:MAG: transposon-encoded TnpW family protein [Defluviitaleaceae bacterium]|nr:transposon-encoded TnpW family protein [Defluviitaleaceae bacterium]
MCPLKILRRTKPILQQTNPTIKTQPPRNAPPTFRRRIGTTTYTVAIHYNERSKEKLEDKIFRMMESEVRESA